MMGMHLCVAFCVDLCCVFIDFELHSHVNHNKTGNYHTVTMEIGKIMEAIRKQVCIPLSLCVSVSVLLCMHIRMCLCLTLRVCLFAIVCNLGVVSQLESTSIPLKITACALFASLCVRWH